MAQIPISRGEKNTNNLCWFKFSQPSHIFLMAKGNSSFKTEVQTLNRDEPKQTGSIYGTLSHHLLQGGKSCVLRVSTSKYSKWEIEGRGNRLAEKKSPCPSKTRLTGNTFWSSLRAFPPPPAVSLHQEEVNQPGY